MSEDRGDPVEPRCPECGGQVVYNGNYFCTACEWELPDVHDPDNPPNYATRQLFEAMLASLMEYRGKRHA